MLQATRKRSIGQQEMNNKGKASQYSVTGGKEKKLTLSLIERLAARQFSLVSREKSSP